MSWGYGAEDGPHTWAKLFEAAGGNRQSPINIQSNEVAPDPKLSSNPLRWSYPVQSSSIVNTGHGWKVNVEGEGSVLEGGPLKDKYQLAQYHCHWGEHDLVGSEHLVDDQPYAAEIHFVHWNTKYGDIGEALKHGDGLAVLGVFFKVGKENPELNSLISTIPSISHKEKKCDFKQPIPTRLLPESHCYWTYLGSLTTPPCNECVIWIVFKEQIELSHEQLECFRTLSATNEENENEELIKNNFRPCLPRGDRPVKVSYS